MLLKHSSEVTDPLFRSQGPLRVVRVEQCGEETMDVASTVL